MQVAQAAKWAEDQPEQINDLARLRLKGQIDKSNMRQVFETMLTRFLKMQKIWLTLTGLEFQQRSMKTQCKLSEKGKTL